MFIGFFLSILLSISTQQNPEFQYFFAAALVIFFLGLKDDLIILSASKKFVGQVIAVPRESEPIEPSLHLPQMVAVEAVGQAKAHLLGHRLRAAVLLGAVPAHLAEAVGQGVGDSGGHHDRRQALPAMVGVGVDADLAAAPARGVGQAPARRPLAVEDDEAKAPGEEGVGRAPVAAGPALNMMLLQGGPGEDRASRRMRAMPAGTEWWKGAARARSP